MRDVCLVDVSQKCRMQRTIRPTKYFGLFVGTREVRTVEVIQDAYGLQSRQIGGEGRISIKHAQGYETSHPVVRIQEVFYMQ